MSVLKYLQELTRLHEERTNMTTWIKYADKKPDIMDIVCVKFMHPNNTTYRSGVICDGMFDIVLSTTEGCFRISSEDEYIILEKSTPAKVVKERPVIQRYDAVNIDAPYRTLIVTYCQEGNYEGRDLFGGHRVFFVREVKQHYRNGELIWSREE